MTGGGLLGDVRVLSFTQFYMGPIAAQYLSDMGADVIKIEPPGQGAWERSWSPGNVWPGGVSLLLALATRNVRSLSLDLKHDRAMEVLERLIGSADVILHNFRPGVMERLGLGYEAVHEINPRIVYAIGSGYGSDNPFSKLPGQDLLLQALSGLAWVTGPADRPPTPTGAPIVDAHGGTLLALGALGALHQQRLTGVGQKVEVTMLQAALDLQAEPLTTFLNGGLLEKASVPLASPQGQAPTGIYPTADGFVGITASTATTIAEISAVLGEPERLAPYLEPDANTFERREEIYDALADCTRAMATASLVEALRSVKLWCSPVLSYADLLDDPIVKEVDPIVVAPHPRATRLRLLKHPISYSEGTREATSVAPDPGQHTNEILASLGYLDQEVAELRAAGTV